MLCLFIFAVSLTNSIYRAARLSQVYIVVRFMQANIHVASTLLKIVKSSDVCWTMIVVLKLRLIDSLY